MHNFLKLSIETESCPICGQRTFGDKYKNSDGQNICYKCFENLYMAACHHCNRPTEITKLQANKQKYGEFICDYCATRSDQCDSCEEYFPEFKFKETADGEKICPECLENYYFRCPTCNRIVSEKDFVKDNIGNVYGCDYCYIQCPICGRYRPITSTEKIDGEIICNQCFEEEYATCDNCHDIVLGTQLRSTEDQEEENPRLLCKKCFDKEFNKCERCGKIDSEGLLNIYGVKLCHDCYDESYHAPAPFKEENTTSLSFNKLSHHLHQLKKLVPISVKDLKQKYPALAKSVQDLIVFSHGRDLTPEIIQQFEAQLPTTEYQMQYSGWGIPLQRSFAPESGENQLVLHIVDPQAKTKLSPLAYTLFSLLNQNSKEKEHPMKKDQLGWVRLELHPEKSYLLIDEIQTDHSGYVNICLHGTEQNKLMVKNKISSVTAVPVDEVKLDEIAMEIKKLIQNFPTLAMQTVTKFAQTHGYKKLFYHTLNGAVKLKEISPPQSLYTQLPAQHYFKETEDKPFDIDSQFLAREAREEYHQSLIKLQFLQALNKY